MTITEFVLILAFVFLVLAMVFQSQAESIKEEKYQIKKDVAQLVDFVNDLSQKLGLKRIKPNVTDEYALRELNKRVNEINGYITRPIKISEDWETLVFVNNFLQQEGVSIPELKNYPDMINELERSKQKLEDKGRDLNNCVTEVRRQRKICGTGYPICNGSGNFLASFVLHDESVGVETLREVKGVTPGFSNSTYTYQEFRDTGDLYFDFSTVQIPECRFQVKVSDKTSPTSKDVYKLAIDAIDDRFYKLLE